MAYRVELPDGTVVLCDTSAELREVIRISNSVGLRVDSSPSRGERAHVDPWAELALALQIISDSGEGGISSGALVDLVGFGDARAIGPKTKRWTRLLADIGLMFDRVAINRKVSEEQRRWFAGPDLQEALMICLSRAEAGGRRGESPEGP